MEVHHQQPPTPPIPITVQGKVGARTLKGTIGDSGRDLELETVNGSFRIRKAG